MVKTIATVVDSVEAEAKAEGSMILIPSTMLTQGYNSECL